MKFFISFIILSFVSTIIVKIFFDNNNVINYNSNGKEIRSNKIAKDTIYSNDIFTENVFVKDTNYKEINLKEIEIIKDTVMVFVWCKTCGACIKYLNWYKSENKEKNYQILAIAITKNDSIEKEKSIINKNQWTFQLYYDNKQNLAKFFTKKGYYKNPNYKSDGYVFNGFPKVFMFVKNKFLCNGCDKYSNPYHYKKN